MVSQLGITIRFIHPLLPYINGLITENKRIRCTGSQSQKKGGGGGGPLNASLCKRGRKIEYVFLTHKRTNTYFFFVPFQTHARHNQLVAICLIHSVIINKCHWLRDRDKPLCQSFLLYSNLFKTCQCKGKLHIIITKPFLQRCFKCLCMCEGEREKGLTRKMQLFWGGSLLYMKGCRFRGLPRATYG